MQFKKHGIKLRVANTWTFDKPDEGWKFEKQLKREANFARHCKYCAKREERNRAKQNSSRRRRRAKRRRERINA